MACLHRVLTFIALVTGLAGTAMGIYSCYKISQWSGQSIWCTACLDMFPSDPNKCDPVCGDEETD